MTTSRRLLEYLKPYRSRFAQAFLFMSLVAAANAGSVYLLKPVVDKFFVQKDWAMLQTILWVLPSVFLIKSAASYLENYLMYFIGQRVAQTLRQDLFRHLQSLTLEFYSKSRSGDILSRATNDLTAVRDGIVSVPIYLIRDGLTILCLTGLLFYLHWKFALWALTSLPIAAWILIVLGKKMRRSGKKSQIIMAELYNQFQENLQGMTIVKAFSQEAHSLEKFRRENQSFFDTIMRYSRAAALSPSLMETLGSVILTGILWYGGRQILQGSLTPGAFVAFMGSFLAAYAPVKRLAQTNPNLQLALSAAERIFQILDEKPTITEKPNAVRLEAFRNSICLENVGFRYPQSELWALKNLNLAFHKGEAVAIVGASGAGKTTLSYLLLRFYDPTLGNIRMDGTDLRDAALPSLRRQIGLVQQETILFNATIRENITLGRPAEDDEICRAARAAHAEEFIRESPLGYDTLVGERGMKLSGGQRQRLAIARAILKNPSIILFDEATSHLDAESERFVQEALEELMEDRTVILIAHRLATIRNVDRIVVLHAGQVMEEGDHERLFSLNGIYHKLFELQKMEPAHAGIPSLDI